MCVYVCFQALSLKSKRTLADLREVLNSEKSYKAMREYLMHINPPCIPYLGISILVLIVIALCFLSIFEKLIYRVSPLLRNVSYRSHVH